jgi:hypothetical protein
VPTPNPRSVAIPDDQYRRIAIAASTLGMSVSAYIRMSCTVTLNEFAAHDPALRAHFAVLDEREASATEAREAELPERVSVSA